MTDIRPALVPADCDLQDFPFMPLHVARLRDSDLAAEEDPEACWYAVLLWAASWHQLPAASLPDSDTVLCKLIGLGRDLKTWRKHRAAALRGFVKCEDGRLYHPVVVEQALDAWKSKLEQRWRTECARVRKFNQRNSTEHAQPTLEDFVSRDFPLSVPFMSRGQVDDVTRDKGDVSHGTSQGQVSDIGSKRQGQGQGQGNIEEEAPPTPSNSTEPEPAALPDAEPGKKREYEFEGRTIRLNRADFDRWRVAYHAIPDLRAELQSLDDWLQGPNVSDAKRKGWFNGISALLGRKHAEGLAAQQAVSAEERAFDRRHPPRELSEADARALMTEAEFERWKARQAA